ncbi:LTA synthase family protein [Lacticaseibacillus pabuli]|uniref:LTA synthase family protein n=1 Tax=Lacticaseibacillus pabuli TaxID=3025672 RepID=A0ABY7WSG0_9LACO|nr:LTA synthase family protein [Lacticaseibacillus sp. KACC 23028]WDF82070.1 LTA synthase family protein [Lacticaseibacillus sp. KACC 23028]
MKQFGGRIRSFFNSRPGFMILAIALFWIKTFWAYNTKFNLGADTSFQRMLLALNPIPSTLLLFGIILYMKGRKSYVALLVVDAITSAWLFANVLYYREFSDFMTFALMKTGGSVSNNLSKAIFGIIQPSDFLVFADVIILILLLAFRVVRVNIDPIKKRVALLVSVLAILLFGANLSMAYHDRSGLLTRTFDSNYIVKYLGLNVYAVNDGVKTAQNSAVKANATSSDLNSTLRWIKNNRVAPNVQYTGVAKGKNVFVIHLESFQQFLIDYKYDGQEVTPNLNKIYHENDTLSFDNFFNQVGQGKTSDAEMMLENSLFGLAEGSAMSMDGSSNTFQAAPAILQQQAGYTTAAFHGDVPSYWNRENTYKNWGYDYWITKGYMKDKKSYEIGYGLKDKIFLHEAAPYIEQLPQPFYAKVITLTNHYPYPLDKKNISIPKTKTGDKTVDGYVQTARYLDQSIGEFMKWLDKSGLAKNSIVMFYGDHYGISDNHKKAMAKLTGIKGFNDYDNAMYQRVPLMFHMQGLKGGINHTYGGEIDVLPTLFNLLGVKDSQYVQFGSDLLAPNRNQIVAQRNGDFISPTITKVGSKYYNTQNGKLITNPTPQQKADENAGVNRTTTVLSLSDRVINGDLLRFYHPEGFKKVDGADYSYKMSKAKKKLKAAQKKKTSVLSQHDGKYTEFDTDAPELGGPDQTISTSSSSSSSSSSK